MAGRAPQRTSVGRKTPLMVTLAICWALAMTDYANVFVPRNIAPTPTAKFEDWVRTAGGGDTYATRHVLDCKTPQEIQDVALAAKLGRVLINRSPHPLTGESRRGRLELNLY